MPISASTKLYNVYKVAIFWLSIEDDILFMIRGLSSESK